MVGVRGGGGPGEWVSRAVEVGRSWVQKRCEVEGSQRWGRGAVAKKVSVRSFCSGCAVVARGRWRGDDGVGARWQCENAVA